MLLTANLLSKKREGGELTDAEIEFLIDGFCRGDVADHQMSALAMAICINGMTSDETAVLTRAMFHSGHQLPRTGSRPRLDKHSTGGLGDKVSLVLAPLLSACGVDVPMISGRGLGRTGGTLDKLESIPGFRTDLDADASSRVLREAGAFIIGASDTVAPADRRLYAIRDVTGTVESIPLITASILSKKLAGNLDGLVMDVKAGSAAFMKTTADAIELARTLIQVGAQAGLPTTALVTDMDQPLGRAIGNAIEVNEAIDVLEGGGPDEVRQLVLDLAAVGLAHAGVAESEDAAGKVAAQRLDSGEARNCFEMMVRAQSGRLRGQLPLASAHPIKADRSGSIAAIDNASIADVLIALGGGRRRMDDAIDPSVGVLVHVRIGDVVSSDEPILTLHASDRCADEYRERLRRSVRIVGEAVKARPLVIERLTTDASTRG